MNGPEYNEFSDESDAISEQTLFVENMEMARLDVGAAWAYMATIRDRYEAESRSIPALMQLRRLADFVAQSSVTAEFPDEAVDVTDAFYEGALLAYDVTAQHYDEDWPEIAAMLFADAMNEHTEQYRGDMWTASQMQRAADDILFPAEWDGDGEDDAPLDAMVRRWATEIYGYTDKQRYMLMGFRHIFTQILDHEAEKTEQDTFEAMMVEAELDRDFPRTRNVNDLRDDVLAAVRDQMNSFGPVDMDDPLRVLTASNSYTYASERVMQSQDQIAPGDDVVLHGIDVSYILYDDAVTTEQTTKLLASHEKIEGEFVSVEMMHIPVTASAGQLYELVMGKGADASAESTIDKHHIVPVMVLKQVTIMSKPIEDRHIPAGSSIKKVVPTFENVTQDTYVAVILNQTLDIAVYE